MGIFNYNSKDEEFKDLTATLRSLPKVKADDDFEYKLMVRIQNKNFNIKSEDRHFGYYSRRLVPAAAVAFTVVIAFFVVNDAPVNLDNPLLKEPPARQASVHGQADTIEIATTPIYSSRAIPVAQTVAQESSVAKATEDDNVMKVVVQQNDVVAEVNKQAYPFDQSRSLDLDSYVSGEQQAASKQQGMLVGGVQESSNSHFGGFLMREKPSQEVIAAYKAMLDSLKKAKQRTN